MKEDQKTNPHSHTHTVKTDCTRTNKSTLFILCNLQRKHSEYYEYNQHVIYLHLEKHDKAKMDT